MTTEKVSIQKDITSVNFSIYMKSTGDEFNSTIDLIGDLSFSEVMKRLKELYELPMLTIEINDIVVNTYTYEMTVPEFIFNAKQISINGKRCK